MKVAVEGCSWEERGNVKVKASGGVQTLQCVDILKVGAEVFSLFHWRCLSFQSRFVLVLTFI
jgi:deoxyribose-phosphate aldolase